ncbi:MAG: hypothetical protein M1830_009216 [Pleopsidium flavum]|nr:MAG: hypothetical protein M1830_009216 [Pleopsidium flavum]
MTEKQELFMNTAEENVDISNNTVKNETSVKQSAEELKVSSENVMAEKPEGEEKKSTGIFYKNAEGKVMIRIKANLKKRDIKEQK